MSKNPLVSIVIPCYNAEQYVGGAIQSALGQTYTHKEVIVIDDGSTDGSLEIIRSFGDAVRWESGPNHGGCAARNRGIELARGELVQFLDADDLLHAEKLERQVQRGQKCPCAIVYCDHVAYGVDNTSEPTLRSMSCEGLDPVIFVLRHRLLHTTGPLHRLNWLREVAGFRVGLHASQEFDLHLRLAAAGYQFAHLSKALFTVRRRPDSVSSDTGRTFAAIIECFPDIISDLDRRGELSTPRRREFAAYAARAGRLCLRFGQEIAGLELLNVADDLDSASAEHAAYSLPARIMKRLFGPLVVERFGRVRRAVRRPLSWNPR